MPRTQYRYQHIVDLSLVAVPNAFQQPLVDQAFKNLPMRCGIMGLFQQNFADSAHEF